jgi:hypothetical protein
LLVYITQITNPFKSHSKESDSDIHQQPVYPPLVSSINQAQIAMGKQDQRRKKVSFYQKGLRKPSEIR